MGLVRAQSNKTGLKGEGSDLGFPFFYFVVLGESKGRRREKREDEDGERIHGFSPPKTAAVFSFRRRANEELLETTTTDFVRPEPPSAVVNQRVPIWVLHRTPVLKLVEAVEPFAAWALGNNLAPRFFVRKIWEHNNLPIRCTAS
ncbi:hypothetical protein Lal_00036897 [Lupinus albus]|nr:hypothetical protein Lal_00036897 [Lupinus albus]